jgi:hypothetical protein
LEWILFRKKLLSFLDGFVKSPSAALRFTPQFLRALHLSFYETIVLITYCEIIFIGIQRFEASGPFGIFGMG